MSGISTVQIKSSGGNVEFLPMEDITAKELADIVAHVLVPALCGNVEEAICNNLPNLNDCQRHFRPLIEDQSSGK